MLGAQLEIFCCFFVPEMVAYQQRHDATATATPRPRPRSGAGTEGASVLMHVIYSFRVVPPSPQQRKQNNKKKDWGETGASGVCLRVNDGPCLLPVETKEG